MSFLQRELDRIGEVLRSPQSSNRYAELYAAQQTLVWALEPTGFKAPYDMIVGTSIPADLEDCLAGNGRSPFSDTVGRRAS